MKFDPVYFKEKLKIINPYGAIGVVTLWSGIDYIYRMFHHHGIDMNPETSPIAVMGNLYGEGFRFLLRNLLYNPQVDTLIVTGNDRSGSSRYIENFFSKGVTPFPTDIVYRCESVERKIGAVKIVDTNHIMDDLVSPSLFSNPINILHIKGLEASDGNNLETLERFFREYTPKPVRPERIFIEAPEVVVQSYPCNPRAQIIVEDHPAEAWKDLIHRIYRFGQRRTIRKGERIELQNVKVVIEKPIFENEDIIEACGFDPASFRRYQTEILSPHLSGDRTYSYGHRIRSYFGLDTLTAVIDDLKKALDDRAGYITTWDNRIDITGAHRPCLVSLFFRKIDDALHLTATFRTHNASHAWLENVYGLMAIQDEIRKATGLETGSITVISHSITLDPGYLEKAKKIHDAASQRNRIREDPNGYFLISTDQDAIIVQHYHAGNKLGEYRSSKPQKIQHMLNRDAAISDINHAIYIGRQLEKARQCIESGQTFIQD